MEKIAMIGLSLGATGIIGAAANGDLNTFLPFLENETTVEESITADTQSTEDQALTLGLDASVDLGGSEEPASTEPTETPTPSPTTAPVQNPSTTPAPVQPAVQQPETQTETPVTTPAPEQPAQTTADSTPETTNEVATETEAAANISLPVVEVSVSNNETSGISLRLGL